MQFAHPADIQIGTLTTRVELRFLPYRTILEVYIWHETDHP